MRDSEKNYTLIRTLMILFFACAWMSVNIYFLALPELLHVFHLTPAALKLSITLFFTGYAFSQLIWASMSENMVVVKPFLSACVLRRLVLLLQ